MGALDFDEDGDLKINQNFKSLLNYFFTMQGRFPNSYIRKVFKDYLSQQDEDTIELALETFDNYQSYLSELKQIMNDVNSKKDIQELIELRRELRREYFGTQVADDFFSLEEDYEDFQLALTKFDKNDYSQQELGRIIDELGEQYLSPKQIANRRHTFGFKNLKADIADLPAQAKEAEVRQRFGDDAGDRFEKLQERQASWQNRLKLYKEYRRDLLSSNLDRTELVGRLNIYKKMYFSPTEVRRVSSIETLWDWLDRFSTAGTP